MSTEPRSRPDRIPCILNPQAKRTAGAATAIEADSRFDLYECDPATVAEVLESKLPEGHRRVMVAGGDGTIATAAGVLAGTGIELAILPGGTLNHFARRHGIPTDLEQAREVAATGLPREVDIAYINDVPFLGTSAVGAYVRFVHSRENWEPRLGYWLASAAAAIRIFARLPDYEVTLDMEGERQRYRTPLLFVGVGERELKFPSLGDPVPGGMSGLHTLVVRGRARARLVAMMLATSAKGVHWAARTPHLESFLLEELRVDLPQASAYVAVDGETMRLSLPFEYRLARRALRIIVPAPSDPSTGPRPPVV